MFFQFGAGGGGPFVFDGGDDDDFSHRYAGGGGGGRQRPRQPPDTTAYYKVLNIEKTASETDVRKAYKKLAVQHHPDRGGDPEHFKKLSVAYEVLSCPKKRKIYDSHGEEGLKAGAEKGHDIFGRGPRGPPKCPSIKVTLDVTLEELYMGSLRKVVVERERVCSTCSGTGVRSANCKRECNGCHGSGWKIVVRSRGRGFIEQSQVPCNRCEGTGIFVLNKDKCHECKGELMQQDKKDIEVDVRAGMHDKEKIVFEGEGHQQPEHVDGDVVVVLAEQKHARFERKGCDLMASVDVTLAEALCGATIDIAHLDGRKLSLQVSPGDIITSGCVKKLECEGMPKHENAFLKGDLFLRFRVVFPNALTEAQMATLKATLPAQALPSRKHLLSGNDDITESEEHTVSPVSAEEFGKQDGGERYAHDEDDEDTDDEDEGGEPVGCRQM